MDGPTLLTSDVIYQWPQGVELWLFAPERDDRAVFEMLEQAFQDHWEYTPEDFAEWRYWRSNRLILIPRHTLLPGSAINRLVARYVMLVRQAG